MVISNVRYVEIICLVDAVSILGDRSISGQTHQGMAPICSSGSTYLDTDRLPGISLSEVVKTVPRYSEDRHSLADNITSRCGGSRTRVCLLVGGGPLMRAPSNTGTKGLHPEGYPPSCMK